jgi:hypothetical protein
MLPSLPLLEKISQEIMSVPNRRKESKRGVHYGLFLLGYKSGLRIGEAVNFDLTNKTKCGLYRIEKPKGKKEWFVYVPKDVIGELKKHGGKPNSTNRWNFYHFLRKIKRELNVGVNVELTPHTLRRSFTTYHAENGLSLPILSKMLGHASVRTTALYWRNIHQEPDNDDIGSILAGKNWLEKKKTPHSPTMENFPKRPFLNLEPIIRDKPVILHQKPIQQGNSLLNSRKQEKKPTITNYQPKSVISQVPVQQKLFLNITTQSKEISEQLPPITSESEKEQVLLAKIKKLEAENSNLKSLVQSAKQNNQLLNKTLANLTHKIQADKQNHTNLINAYQKAFNDKVKAELFAEREKQRADNYQQQLKSIAKTLKQWQKINYYQQLEAEKKEQEIKAQIIQLPLPKLILGSGDILSFPSHYFFFSRS